MIFVWNIYIRVQRPSTSNHHSCVPMARCVRESKFIIIKKANWSFENHFSIMLAQQKIVLIKEAIKLTFRRVEYLEHQHLWVRLQAQNGQKQITFFWNLSGYSCSEKWRLFHARNCQETEDLSQHCTTPFTEQHKLALTRIERGVGGPGAQLSKRTSTIERLVWETDTSQVLNWQLH